jgi:uncharacterized protein YutE (UPF0331/DUF86 family)
MPVNPDQLKQRINEVLGAKTELNRLPTKPYIKLSMDEKFAIRYHVIVLAEALGAVCLHIAKEDLGYEPLSYSECFGLLDEEGICGKCAKDLSAIVRLRNLLTHRYWTIDDQLVYNSIKDDFNGVDKFLSSVGEEYAIEV